MLEKPTKQAYQSMINDKNMEKRTCQKFQTKLKGLKRDIEGEVREWGTQYRKNNQCEATKNVIKKGSFEGKNAERTQTLYQGKVRHMNTKYLQKITSVCERLDEQISAVEAYIEELDRSITKLQSDMGSMEG